MLPPTSVVVSVDAIAAGVYSTDIASGNGLAIEPGHLAPAALDQA
jgi:hypothetical protein